MSKYYSSSIAFGAQQTKTERVVVSPTKIGDVTTDAVSGALTVDEVPVLNSLNPVSSDGVARAVIQAGAELPTRGSSDTGKVLTVANSDGDLEWDEPASDLPDMAGQDGKLLGAVDNNGTMEAQWVNPPESYPSVAGNANKVLTVNSGATGVEWAAIPAPSVDEVPDVGSSDDGKVLTASYSGGQGSYSWQTAQGGGGASYTASAPIAIESDDIKLNYNDTLKLANKFTVKTTSADANNTIITGDYFNNGCYGLYVYNTGINLPKSAGSLAILYKKPSNYYQDMKITGAAAAGATGWTVVIYDPKAPTSNYCIANEEYEFAGTSGDDAIVFKTYSSADTNIYYKFTFSTANCHGTVTGDLLGIQIIPLPTSATSGSSCAGTTYLNMVNQGHNGNYDFAVYGTISPVSELPAANSGSFSNTASELAVNGTNAVPVDPSQFTKTTKSVNPAGAVGDTLGTYGYMGVKNNASFRTGNPYIGDQTVRFSLNWAANGSWLYDQPSGFTTSQTLASDVRVLFYNPSNPTQYCEFTGVTGLGYNWTTYTVGILGNYWDRYGTCYGPTGSTSTAGYWSIDFVINSNTSRGTNTTYMDWQNIVTNPNYAICFYTPGTTGTAPNGCDYSSIPEAILAKLGAVQEAGLLKVQDKLLVPASSTADNGKVLTVSSGNAVWATPAAPSVDEVPDVTSADNGKVLTASYSGGVGSYSWQTAQGGGGGASYTAGQGIAIDGNNAISVEASSTDFVFGQRQDLQHWANNYAFIMPSLNPPKVISTKDASYNYMVAETGNVHLVSDNTGMVAGNYAVCNASYAFSNWQLTSDVKIALSTTASDWTFTGNTFNIGNGLIYITVAGTTGSTITPNGETPVQIYLADQNQFVTITNPNQLSLKNSIPSYSSSDAGKVLQVQNDGTLAWVTLS